MTRSMFFNVAPPSWRLSGDASFPARSRLAPFEFRDLFVPARTRANRGLRWFLRRLNHSLRYAPLFLEPTRNCQRNAAKSTLGRAGPPANADTRDRVILAKPPPTRRATIHFRSRGEAMPRAT